MATDGRGLQGRRSTVLGFKERRRAFLTGGLHLLNVEVVGARLLPLELPVAAEASPLALVRWLREPAVRKAHMARIGQDCFLPEEPPDWDAARPTDWVAAENPEPPRPFACIDETTLDVWSAGDFHRTFRATPLTRLGCGASGR